MSRQVVLEKENCSIVKLTDYETSSIPNPNKDIFYVVNRIGQYLWKFGEFRDGVGPHEGLHEKYVDCPGIFASQTEAEICLDNYLKNKEKSHAT